MDASLVIGILRTTVIVCICYYLYIQHRKNSRFETQINKLPGPKTWPIIGNLIQIGAFSKAMKRIHPQIVFSQNRRGLCQIFSNEKIFRLWFGSSPFVFFFRKESVQVLLSSNVLTEKNVTYSLLDNYLGDSLFLIKGDMWKTQRRSMTPAFHFRIVQDFVHVVNDHLKHFVKRLQTLCDEDWIDTLPELTMCTLDIFSESSFGVSLRNKEKEKMAYFNSIRKILHYSGLRSNLPWLTPNFIFDHLKGGKRNAEVIKIARKFTAEIIKEKKEILKAQQKTAKPTKEEPRETKDGEENENIYFLGDKKRLGSLDLLMNMVDKGQITETRMADEVTSFIFAGHDTTSISLAMTLYLIGSHPEVQEKIVEELRSIYGENREQPVTYEDLTKLKYTECVIKESLRLYPPVPIIGRRITEDVKIDGHTVPKGTQCTLLIQEVHRDPDVFPNPEAFDPERFLPEKCAKMHPYAHIPFSAGARNCIGQRFSVVEEKIFIATLLRNFELHSLDPVEKIHVIPEVVMKINGPIRIKFTERP